MSEGRMGPLFYLLLIQTKKKLKKLLKNVKKHYVESQKHDI